MRIIEERTKVKDSDNQLNNSALSGAEFATFYAILRQKRVKSPKNRKNAKSVKRAENEQKGRKAANFRRRSRSQARRRACDARVCEAVGHRRPPSALASCGSDAPRSASAHETLWCITCHVVSAHDGCHAPSYDACASGRSCLPSGVHEPTLVEAECGRWLASAII
jgi:hypothetical protein